MSIYIFSFFRIFSNYLLCDFHAAGNFSPSLGASMPSLLFAASFLLHIPSSRSYPVIAPYACRPYNRGGTGRSEAEGWQASNHIRSLTRPFCTTGSVIARRERSERRGNLREPAPLIRTSYLHKKTNLQVRVRKTVNGAYRDPYAPLTVHIFDLWQPWLSLWESCHRR